MRRTIATQVQGARLIAEARQREAAPEQNYIGAITQEGQRLRTPIPISAKPDDYITQALAASQTAAQHQREASCSQGADRLRHEIQAEVMRQISNDALSRYLASQI